jgi:D-threo-aldose 1-dehydrogenase
MSDPTVPLRPVGKTAISVSEVGLGAASVGNLYRVVTANDAQSILQRALQSGFTYIDTAPLYGFGLSERRVGDAVRCRKDAVVSTKVGRLLDPDRDVNSESVRDGFYSAMPFRPRFDYRYDAVMKSWEASLQRLGLAKIDILYVHDIDAQTHGESHSLMLEQLTKGGGLRALQTLRADGAIGAFGLGVNEVPICLDILKEVELDVILLAGRYTLLEPEGLDVLAPICAEVGTSIIVGAPFNSGILATGTHAGVIPHYNYAPPTGAIIERVARIEVVCHRHHVPLAAAALQFPLAHPQVASVIPGIGLPDQVSDTLRQYRTDIAPDFWWELKRQDLLPENACLPNHAPS